MKNLARFASISLLMLSASQVFANNQMQTSATSVKFFDFTYEGKDAIFSEQLKQNEFQNPIIAGFYPDPSVVRVGEDYYLATSSFSYSPGVPLFHSKDLVNWQSIGHALVTNEQLPLFEQGTSRGIYAPTLRHHNGTFYLITTLVDVRGNFIVTAKDPRGPWSDPILLPEIGGIDPDIFFDDDGKIYISHNDGPEGEPLYEGHRAIWLWEYDANQQKVVPGSRKLLVNGGTDLAKKPVWIEAPHIYKINGWYYLVCAEGGTGYEHSAVVFRTKSLADPFVPYEGNPILTQRDLDINRPNPITTAGHADLVQTKEGDWWAVFLATRSYDKTLYNTGRETFLHPVTWTEDGWPIILPQGETLPYRAVKPNIKAQTPNPTPTTGNFLWRDSFEDKTLKNEWVRLRSAPTSFYSINTDHGTLNLEAKAVNLTQLDQPAFLGRRQQHTKFSTHTHFSLPQQNNISAGLAVFQSEEAHYYFGVKKVSDHHVWFIEKTYKNKPRIIASGTVANHNKAQTVTLGTNGNAGVLNFYYVNSRGKKITALKDVDASLLSTEKAGGFVGVLLGMHARREITTLSN